MKRVFLIVLDSVGIGEMPDASLYGDVGSNTLRSCSKSEYFNIINMKRLGLFNIDSVYFGEYEQNPIGSFARMTEKSNGKDTTIGHWEIAGLVTNKPFPVYPNGFPDEIIYKFENLTGYKILCNKTYSGTEVIKNYGEESIRDNKVIVYTSADSVFQIAAHEDIVNINKLYEICKIARKILCNNHAVGRVIARPFVGDNSQNFTRTSNRRDFSLEPHGVTMLDILTKNKKDVISVGKISDIFANRGITKFVKTKNNQDGIEKLLNIMKENFNGLCFVNLVDFDMLYGHRNDIDGYAQALTYFDKKVSEILQKLKGDDVLIITADHGCDPGANSTDHSREYVPMLIYGKNIKSGVNLGTRESFGDISATILEYFGLNKLNNFNSFLGDVLK